MNVFLLENFSLERSAIVIATDEIHAKGLMCERVPHIKKGTIPRSRSESAHWHSKLTRVQKLGESGLMPRIVLEGDMI